jgi:hypothetical protein
MDIRPCDFKQLKCVMEYVRTYIYLYINAFANNVILRASYIYDLIFIRQFLK